MNGIVIIKKINESLFKNKTSGNVITLMNMTVPIDSIPLGVGKRLKRKGNSYESEYFVSYVKGVNPTLGPLIIKAILANEELEGTTISCTTVLGSLTIQYPKDNALQEDLWFCFS